VLHIFYYAKLIYLVKRETLLQKFLIKLHKRILFKYDTVITLCFRTLIINYFGEKIGVSDNKGCQKNMFLCIEKIIMSMKNRGCPEKKGRPNTKGNNGIQNTMLLAVDGEALLCSLISKTVLHTYHFHAPIHAIKFSPDGRWVGAHILYTWKIVFSLYSFLKFHWYMVWLKYEECK